MFQPTSIDEVCQLVRDHDRLLPVGRRTKPPLSDVDSVELVSMTEFSGITQYEPSEFTFTAKAGTPLSTITQALAEKNQYLPFDPLLVDAGATLGGTTAANMAGPGRMRYGGVRDFILGLQHVDGDGAVINSGGKVVKNAAGFDIPKLMVGSLGRYGVLTELTFKVFPRPPARLTLRIGADDASAATEWMTIAANSRWEVDALDYSPAQTCVLLRLAGPEPSLQNLLADIRSVIPATIDPISGGDADALWSGIRELTFGGAASHVIKIPATTRLVAPLTEEFSKIDSASVHFCCSGNVAWVSLQEPSGDAFAAVDQALRNRDLSGQVVRGESAPAMIGDWPSQEIQRRLKDALDPSHTFPSFQ